MKERIPLPPAAAIHHVAELERAREKWHEHWRACRRCQSLELCEESRELLVKAGFKPGGRGPKYRPKM